MRPRVLFFALAVMLVVWGQVSLREGDPGLEAASNVVVMIDGEYGQGAGVVFAVREGFVWIATMHHVVRKPGTQGGDDHLARNLRVRFRSRRLSTSPAEHHDQATAEVAVIKVKGTDLQFDWARLGAPDALVRGADVYAIGHPAGDNWGVTWNPGKVNNRGSDWLELLSADIEPGHSGGALLDGERRLVGMVNMRGGGRARALRMDKAIRVLRDDLELPVDLVAAGRTPTTPVTVAPPGTVAPPVTVAPPLTVEQRDKGGLRYLKIPRGRFQMGCSTAPEDKECDKSDEYPAHAVEITRDFWMTESEVTVGAYEKYRTATKAAALPEKDDLGRKLNKAVGNDEVPAVAVTWQEAVDYCKWAGGEGMRLPTEAQWEYAARAGTTGARYAADLKAIAWFGDNSGDRTIDSTKIWNDLKPDNEKYAKRLFDNGNTFRPVKGRMKNAWGLYDMLGNVWEWTMDNYARDYYTNSPVDDPEGPTQGTSRVLRGGSWYDYPEVVRVSFRLRYEPTVRYDIIGFRCAGEFR